ncbi:hypothetical protein ABEF95_006606 [Exophiala dermatitidis]
MVVGEAPAANGTLHEFDGVGERSQLRRDEFEDGEFPDSLRGKRVLLFTESHGPVNGVSRTTLSLINYLRDQGVHLAVVSPGSALLGSKGQERDTKPLSEDKVDHKGGSGTFRSRASYTEFRLPGYPLPYNPHLAVVHPFDLNKDILQRMPILFSNSQLSQDPKQGTTKAQYPDLIYLASPASLGFQVLWYLRQLPHSPPVLLNFQTDLSAYSEILFPAPVARFSVWLLGVVQGYLFNNPQTVRTVFYPSSGIREYLEHVGVPRDRLVRLGRGVDTVLFNPSRRSQAYRRRILEADGGDVRPENDQAGDDNSNPTSANNNPTMANLSDDKNENSKEIILLTVCRLAPEKGFDFLSRAMTKLVNSLTTTTTNTNTNTQSSLKSKPQPLRFKLLIVGGNPNPAVTTQIRLQFTSSSILRSQIIFTDFLTGPPLAQAYASADIFLHCSTTETFGLVVLEAMASGVPVVARDQGGPSDIVDHGNTGYLIPPANIDKFVDAVMQLASDAALRSTMARNAREFACRNTWERINARVAGYMARSLELELDSSDSKEPGPNPWTPRPEPSRRNHKTTGTGNLIIRYITSITTSMSTILLGQLQRIRQALRMKAARGVVYVIWALSVGVIFLYGNKSFGSGSSKRSS